MADPVLRIPIDDAAFKRYMAAFERYQAQLQKQPDMWADANDAVLDGVAANLSLADAIGQSVAAAIRLGDVQERNALRRKREAEHTEVEEQRASGWRRKALDHVQKLSRTTASIARSVSGFASGSGTGGLFGMVADAGKGMGGDIGAIVSAIGHTLNAGYEINNTVSDKGQFARGIGATIAQQEGFHNNLGRYTNTDQGLDAIMNARGTPSQWWQFNALGVRDIQSNKSNAAIYGEVLRKQVELAKRYTVNGVTNYAAIDPRGATAFGTTHEDLNRLKALSGTALDKAIKDAVSFKSPLADKQIDAATKSVVAMDNLTTKVQDNTQALAVKLDPSLDKVTKGLNDLTSIINKLYDLFSFKWFGSHGGGGSTSHSKGWGIPGLFWVHGANDAPAASHPSPAVGPGQHHVTHTPAGDVKAFNYIGAYLRKAGFSEAASFGAAAGAIAESHGDSYAHNLKSGAFGIGQWLGKRKERLFAMAKADHVDPHDMKEQLKFLAWELHGGDYGGKAVMGSQSIEAALRAYVYKFMRPQGAHNEHLQDAVNDVKRGLAVAQAANVNVHVKVSAPPGHQSAVTTNSAAKG